jgi:NADPH:quinone reductase-like Zn-dependent oxidoreductase
MKAAFIEKPGGLEVLKYGELPAPKPGPGEALIRVKAAALNHLDIHLRNGIRDTTWPHVSGSDVAGVLAEMNGPGKLKVGQEVVINPAIPCGMCSRCKRGLNCEKVRILGSHLPGGFAEYVVVPIAQVYAKPRNLSFAEAAAFPLTFLTAWHMLVGRAGLQKGETVFIWGASGGLGSAAIQVAKYLGAKVIAAAGTQTDAKKIKAMGADAVVIYTHKNLIEEIKKLNDDNKVDVVFESVGAKTWDRTLAMLRPYGRVVIAGTTSGGQASLDLGDLYYLQHTILGSRMGDPKEFEKVLKLVGNGTLHPVIDKIFPLKDFKQAEKRLEESKQAGKIVIEV